jgi:hypothetical protein
MISFYPTLVPHTDQPSFVRDACLTATCLHQTSQLQPHPNIIAIAIQQKFVTPVIRVASGSISPIKKYCDRLLLVYALTTCLHKHLLTIYTIEK